MAISKEKVKVLSQESIAEGIMSMTLECPEMAAEAKAGQFVNLYLNDTSRVLPRPISICQIDGGKGTLRLVYRVTGDKAGTAELAQLKAGDSLEVMGPLGNGYDIAEVVSRAGEGDIVLSGGGIGIPPMLGLAETIYRESGKRPIAVMGYRNSDFFLREELEQVADLYISTDDGSFGTHGTVIDAMKENEITPAVLCACGPMPMLRGIKAYALEKGAACWISLEERMACGVGACLACVCKTKEEDGHSHVHNARVCKEGPVFPAEDVEI